MQGNETNFKKAVTIPYTQVPNDVLYDGKLSLKAKGLWAYMNAKPSGWFFSADRIAEECSDGREAILAGLRELVAAGLLLAKRKGDGRMEYTLFHNPQWENPIVGHEPQSENPTVGKPHDGKTPLIINKEDNKKRDKEKNSDPAANMFPTPAAPAMDKPACRQRPKRSDYKTDDEYENAMYTWNSMPVMV